MVLQDVSRSPVTQRQFVMRMYVGALCEVQSQRDAPGGHGSLREEAGSEQGLVRCEDWQGGGGR